MKTIRNWDDLKPYGISCLTGEACALSARALCDLTSQGADYLREYLGLLPSVPHQGIFQEAWNRDQAWLWSCFIPWDTLPSLAAFLLIKSGCSCAVHVARDGICGIETSDDQALVEEWLAHQEVTRQYKPFKAPSVGLSCVHAMSGRSE